LVLLLDFPCQERSPGHHFQIHLDELAVLHAVGEVHGVANEIFKLGVGVGLDSGDDSAPEGFKSNVVAPLFWTVPERSSMPSSSPSDFVCDWVTLIATSGDEVHPKRARN